MCNHHYLVELRPDPSDYDTWETIAHVSVDGGLRVSETAEKEGRKAAYEAAARYALAFPEQAQHIQIGRYDCGGPYDDPTFPFADGGLPDSSQLLARLAKEVVRYRQALEFYANEYGWRPKQIVADDGTVAWTAPAADGGQTARRALNETDKEQS
jgi:hypothetical protein